MSDVEEDNTLKQPLLAAEDVNQENILTDDLPTAGSGEDVDEDILTDDLPAAGSGEKEDNNLTEPLLAAEDVNEENILTKNLPAAGSDEEEDNNLTEPLLAAETVDEENMLIEDLRAAGSGEDDDGLAEPLLTAREESLHSADTSFTSVTLSDANYPKSVGLSDVEGGTAAETVTVGAFSSVTGRLYDDSVEEMTYARRIALSWMKYDWYYPKDMKEYHKANNISLDDSWGYYEHITLYRHTKLEPGESASDGLDKAEPGERRFPTQLYNYRKTPHDQLGDFGIGIGVYFDTTWWLAVITLVAGFITLSSSLYLASDDYTDQDAYVHDVNFFLRASALCSNQVFVPCPTCSEDKWTEDNAGNRFAYSKSGLKFAKHNECEGATRRLGYVTALAIVFLCFSVFALNNHEEKVEIAFDEDEQTAQDYSLVVDDCPPDALDPEEWRQFFTDVSGGHVVTVTVSINNGELVNRLVSHRLERERLKRIMNETTSNVNSQSLDSEEYQALIDSTPPTPWYYKLLPFLFVDAHMAYDRLKENEEAIRELSEKEYEVTDVFVTFETEAAQRQALSSLSVGKLAIINQDQTALPENLKFRGKILLDVSEPAEPSAVRWQDIATHWKVRAKGLILSTIWTLVLLYLAAKFVKWRADSGDLYVAIYIATMNVIFPLICRSIVQQEVHPDEGERSVSLYMKVTLFRWVNTAIIIYAATPFTHILSDNDYDLIPRIYTILFAELLSAPLIILIDIGGLFERHFLAPRAKTQEQMNNNMRGTIYEVAERYTTVTKLLFLCFFYAALFPMGFFICSFALFATYYSDKFALLRIWRPAPMIGNEVAEFGREYFFIFALLALVICNAYLYAMFPYDNLCETDEKAGSLYAGTYNVTKVDPDDGPENVTVTVDEDDPTYKYCDQNVFSSGQFPATSDVQDKANGDEWMTGEQEEVVNLIGWAGLGFLLVIMIVKFAAKLYFYVMSYFDGDYDPSGDDQNIPFSKVPSITAYVPQVRTDVFNYPLIACSIEDIDKGYIGFTDAVHGVLKWSLVNEFPSDLKPKVADQSKPILSIVKYYPLEPKG